MNRERQYCQIQKEVTYINDSSQSSLKREEEFHESGVKLYLRVVVGPSVCRVDELA